ncbi:hypothetical protein [Streptomyces buecherae]|uniref:hypothetical protein n=1 Tax=Streptomyces buecherae TaxID=2763006 RepID=UPI00368CCD9D
MRRSAPRADRNGNAADDAGRPSGRSRRSHRPRRATGPLPKPWNPDTPKPPTTGASHALRTTRATHADDPEATIWDSATPQLLFGKPDLDRIRAGRPTVEGADGGPVEAGLTAYDQVVDIFGELAVCRHWVRVDYHDRPSALLRNTAVLRRADGRWLITHLHEDQQDAG